MLLDSECFKLQDSRIKAVQSGRMSVQALALSIQPRDWLFQYKNSIYTLTEDQYYAMQQLQQSVHLSKEVFQRLLQDLPLNVSQQDNKKLLQIKQKKVNCSTCKYNSYKTKVKNIISSYPFIVESYGIKQKVNAIRPYPFQTAEVKSKISLIAPKFFTATQYDRTPCLDCVTKHIGMAYIKGCQSQKGYPQHLILSIANLQEAYEECPKDAQFLRQNLMFCISKSIRQHKAFVPFSNLINLVQIARHTTVNAEANIANQQDTQYALILNQTDKQTLRQLDLISKMRCIQEVQKAIDIVYSDVSQLSIKFQGQMGVLQDTILPYSKNISNILRNRRLIFKYAPQMMRNTQYDCKDILTALKGDL